MPPTTCAEIPDLPVLAFLAHLQVRVQATGCRWATHGDPRYALPTVAVAMPPETPFRLQRAKMIRLMRRGLVVGCGCGCRGDYEITDEGEALVTPEAAEAIRATADAEVDRADVEAARPVDLGPERTLPTRAEA